MNPSATTPPLTGPGGPSSTSLWRHRDFRRYLTSRTAGVAGISISSMAIPVLAVLELDATPGQVARRAFRGRLPPALPAPHAGGGPGPALQATAEHPGRRPWLADSAPSG
ncbi:hypothetical protein [Streptomyces sp. NPDC051310]|uniref:hypothetical protein n=1 Tax=Streptomyces sp. NPDC051310 TaxID=3365649 RepID=UPI0037A8181F